MYVGSPRTYHSSGLMTWKLQSLELSPRFAVGEDFNQAAVRETKWSRPRLQVLSMLLDSDGFGRQEFFEVAQPRT
jgi:hypothetical protein